MTGTTKKLLVAAAMLLTACTARGAAAPPDTVAATPLDTIALGDVVVWGIHPFNEVIPAQRLSGVQLQALSSHSVADAIRYFAGIQLKDYGGVGGVKTVDMRSMGSNHMGVFYDGIQLGNAQNGQIDLGKFSLDNIDEVALYNGQRSDIFQPARDFGNAGTIYLRTRRPRFTDGRRDNVTATVRTGSFGLFNPSLRWEHKLRTGLSMSLSAEGTLAHGMYHFRYRRRFSDGTPAWDTTAVRHNGDIQALRVEAAIFGSMEGGSWNAKAYYYDSERGIPGAIVNNVWHNSQRQWDRNFFVQGTFKRRMSDRYEMMINAKYARDHMRYLNPDTTLLLLDNKFWQNEVYISSANKVTLLPSWDVNLAVDYKWNTLGSTLASFASPVRHTTLAALATAWAWRGLKAQASGLLTLVNDRHVTRRGEAVVARHNKWWHQFTPALFVSYQPLAAHDLNVRAFVKRIFRLPTFNDLYYTDIGNATLRPEYVTQYNVGLQYQLTTQRGFLAALRLTADAYYNRVKDKILAVPSGRGQYRWMMMNIGKVHIRGIDITARAALRPHREVELDVNLNYTFQKAQDMTSPTDTGYGGTYRGQIAYVPWHSGSVIAQLQWRRWMMNYSFIYVGERYHGSANIPANHEQPWYTHDLSLTRRFTWGHHGLKITAEVNNLFNQQYDVILNYPMPGRNYRLSVTYTLQ